MTSESSELRLHRIRSGYPPRRIPVPGGPSARAHTHHHQHHCKDAAGQRPARRAAERVVRAAREAVNEQRDAGRLALRSQQAITAGTQLEKSSTASRPGCAASSPAEARARARAVQRPRGACTPSQLRRLRTHGQGRPDRGAPGHPHLRGDRRLHLAVGGAAAGDRARPARGGARDHRQLQRPRSGSRRSAARSTRSTRASARSQTSASAAPSTARTSAGRSGSAARSSRSG